MILANGIIYDTSMQGQLLAELPSKLVDTLQNNILDINCVLDAFDAMSKKVAAGEFQNIIDEIDYEGKEQYIDMVVHMMSREYLEYKISVELAGSKLYEESVHGKISTKRVPLGVIFHIAAGNMDVLPVTSIAEGLLAGNINILKLPSVDKGLTIKVMKMLVDFEPKLADYIYIFDTPSSDVMGMKKMADMSDGIAVWGGDEVVKAVRELAKPGTRLIEWGHKLGFAYVSGYENKEEELLALADHIMQTRQLLCSSCQVIYLNTDSNEKVKDFAKNFTSYLDRAASKYPIQEIGAVAELSLRRYADELEKYMLEDQADLQAQEIVYRGELCSATASFNSTLELSYMYGNVIVKPLPQKEIAKTLRNSKEYLQTAGLICQKEEREKLTDILLRSGLERVTRPGHMSDYFDGEAHDGEYPLMRYTRIVNKEL